MTDCKAFYRERNRRTVSYMDKGVRTGERIVVAIGPRATDTEAGQFLVLTLANLLARVHRRIDFVVPEFESPLRVWAPFTNADNFGSAVLATAEALDPCGDFRLRSRMPEAGHPGVGVGRAAPTGLLWYLGARGAVARLDRTAVSVDDEFGPGTLRGAGLAACLGASAIFQSLHDVPVRPRTLSAWNYREGTDAAFGPRELAQADPGRVLLVGAGAVGSALAYWLKAWGVGGSWTVVDGDRVELHNTNRSLLFTPEHAGWLKGEGGPKSEIVASVLPDSESVPDWYDEAEDVHGRPFDVILPLANERDVRGQLATRHAVVVVHATTGRNWASQLHRHVKGVDDCLACRMVGGVQWDARCSEAELKSDAEEGGGDAALPYLSAASGLMLATALQRLGEGSLTELPANHCRWYFNSDGGMASSVRRLGCEEECESIKPPSLRKRLVGDRWWRKLDPELSGGPSK